MSESALSGLAVMRFQGRTASGFPCEITQHIRTGGAAANTAEGLAGVAEAGGDWWGSAGVKALHFNGVGLDQVSVQDLSPTSFATVVVPVGAAGTRGTGAPAAAQDSLVVTKNTGLAGAQFRGRMYTWGALAADLDAAGGLWDQAFADAWTAQVDLLYAAIIAAAPVEYAPVLWHQHGYGARPKADPPVPIDPATIDTVTPVTGATGRVQLAVQRSRRR